MRRWHDGLTMATLRTEAQLAARLTAPSADSCAHSGAPNDIVVLLSNCVCTHVHAHVSDSLYVVNHEGPPPYGCGVGALVSACRPERVPVLLARILGPQTAPGADQ